MVRIKLVGDNSLSANSYSTYRLLLLDIDGTVAKDYYSISPAVKKAILKINKKFNVVLVSGRSAKTVLVIVKELKLDKPQIVEGGARIVTPEGNNVWCRFIPYKLVVRIINFLNYNNILFNVCVNGSSILIENNNNLQRVSFKEISRISLLYLKQTQVKRLEDSLKKVNGIYFVKVQNTIKANLWNIDITDRRANKRNAVLKLRRILNIKRRETIGVGDGYNDIPFIKETGFKVAMGNAVLELKKIADYIAPSVSEDGLINVLDLIDT